MDNWRAQLRPSTRKRNFTRIMKTLKAKHYFPDEDALVELQRIAQNFEDKTYAAAASKFDYSRKITTKLRLMEKEASDSRVQEASDVRTDTNDWKGELQPMSRQRIVNKIMDTLKRHLPVSGQEGLCEIRKISQRFEEKVFTTATSQSDYLRKISLKMLTMEASHQGIIGNNIMSNEVGPSNKPPDAVRV